MTLPPDLEDEDDRYADEKLPRHPEFDAYWEQHRGILHWAAKKAARTYGGSYSDYLGTLVLRMNYVLYHYDPARGVKFITYFLKRFSEYILRRWMRYESEGWDLFYHKAVSTDEDFKQTNINYAYHEAANFLYRIPEADSEELAAVMGLFETQDEAWVYFTRGLDAKRKFVIERRFRYEQTLQEIAEPLSITKERVRQLESDALRSIRDKLIKVRAFATLFRNQKEPA